MIERRDKPFWAPKSLAIGPPVFGDGLKALLPLATPRTYQILRIQYFVAPLCGIRTGAWPAMCEMA